MFMVNSCYWFSNAVIDIAIDVCCCRCCCCLCCLCFVHVVSCSCCLFCRFGLCCLCCLCFVAVVCVVYVVYAVAAIDDNDVVAVVVELEAQNFVEERAPAEKAKVHTST